MVYEVWEVDSMSSCMAEPSLTSKKLYVGVTLCVYRHTVYDFGFDISGGLKLKNAFFSLLDPPIQAAFADAFKHPLYI